MGALADIQAAVAVIETTVAGLDPTLLTPHDAAGLFELFASGERLGAAGKSLTARRGANSNLWRTAGQRMGPVPLATARALMVDSFVAAVATDGVDSPKSSTRAGP